jgi:hypothetical protein
MLRLSIKTGCDRKIVLYIYTTSTFAGTTPPECQTSRLPACFRGAREPPGKQAQDGIQRAFPVLCISALSFLLYNKFQFCMVDVPEKKGQYYVPVGR